jgi:hypothetical protein
MKLRNLLFRYATEEIRQLESVGSSCTFRKSAHKRQAPLKSGHYARNVTHLGVDSAETKQSLHKGSLKAKAKGTGIPGDHSDMPFAFSLALAGKPANA